MKRGRFITFEGPEGSGKTTQIRHAMAWLRARGVRATLLREPGGTRLGERVRKLLLAGKGRMADEAELFLFLAARAQLVRDRILPLLARGVTVLADRFQDSTTVYQGYASGLDREIVEACGRLATAGLKPDLTFVFDVETRAGLSRGGRRDRIERKPVSFHRRVRAGYRALSRREPRRIRWIARARKEAVKAEVIRALGRLIRGNR